MSDNVQQLPAGLAGRAAAAVSAPAAPAPAPSPLPVAPVDTGPVLAPAPAPAAPAAPVAPPSNPMLSSASQPKPAEAPAPVEPVAPVEPPKVEPAAPISSVTELAGHLAKDAAIAPAVSYLDAVCKDEGLDVARAFGSAADELDARFIDKHYLIEKLGEEKANTLIKVATDSIAYVQTYNDESLKQVYATTGGEDQFRAAANAFNSKADPVEKATLIDLLNSGVRDKMLYAAQKIAQFGAQAGAIIQHNPQAMGQPGSQRGLSRDEYTKAISERNISPEKYDELKALRRLGMQQGLR